MLRTHISASDSLSMFLLFCLSFYYLSARFIYIFSSISDVLRLFFFSFPFLLFLGFIYFFLVLFIFSWDYPIFSFLYFFLAQGYQSHTLPFRSSFFFYLLFISLCYIFSSLLIYTYFFTFKLRTRTGSSDLVTRLVAEKWGK